MWIFLVAPSSARRSPRIATTSGARALCVAQPLLQRTPSSSYMSRASYAKEVAAAAFVLSAR